MIYEFYCDPGEGCDTDVQFWYRLTPSPVGKGFYNILFLYFMKHVFGAITVKDQMINKVKYTPHFPGFSGSLLAEEPILPLLSPNSLPFLSSLPSFALYPNIFSQLWWASVIYVLCTHV